MSLYDRGKPRCCGAVIAGPVQFTGGLFFILRDNPLSSYFEAPGGDTPTAILNYLTAIQKRTYGEIIDLPRAALLKHIKSALVQYSALDVKRGIRYASWISQYPFSLRFVLEQLDKLGYEKRPVRSQQTETAGQPIIRPQLLWD